MPTGIYLNDGIWFQTIERRLHQASGLLMLLFTIYL